MKNKIFKIASVLLFNLLFCSLISFADEDTKQSKNKTYTISLGYENSLFKDVNYSVLNQKGNGIVLHLQSLRKLKSNDLFQVAIDLPYAITKPKNFHHFRATQTVANIEVAYLKHFPTKNKNINFYLGGQLHSYYHLVFFDGTEAFTMFGVNGLDVSSYVEYTINDNQSINAKASIPVLAQLVRPPYTGWDKYITDNPYNIPKVLTRGKITSLNKFFGFNFDFNYEYQYKENRSINFNYGLRYYTTSEVKKSVVMNNQFNVGLNFKL